MFFFALIGLLLSGQSQPQFPPVGIIDFYGLRTVTEEDARRALPLRVGDPIDISETPLARLQEKVVRSMESLPHVKKAKFNLVCCADGKSIVFVGVEEAGSQSLKFSDAPAGHTQLPVDIIAAGNACAEALQKAVVAGDTGEDRSQGHALNNNPGAQSIERQFIQFAARDAQLLRDVFHNSSDPDQRALAAQVLAYSADKAAVIPDLAAGMRDPSAEVRNNSMRALMVMAEASNSLGSLHLEIPVEPFIAMLNSLVWTDRNKSAAALDALTQKHRDPAILAKLRAEAMPSLVEMARWKSSGHAQSSFALLGRMAGWPEEKIYKTFESGDRESVIAAAPRPTTRPDK